MRFLQKPSERRRGALGRQITALSLSVLVLSGCGQNPTELARGTLGYVSGVLGVVSVEEPQAALIARDILSSGGTAGDAATAIGLTLAVTMPSAASLGGGGLCIAREGGQATPTVIDFLSRAPAAIPSGATRPSAIPGNPRGLFLLHSRYGRLKWEQVITPAERLARFGYKVSRAFAEKYGPLATELAEDSGAAKIFRGQGGGPLREGEILIQSDLAATLSRLRARGAGDLYLGTGASGLVDAVAAAGGSLTVDDLRDYQPVIREPISFSWVESTTWHFAGPPAVGGVVAAEITATLLDGVRFEKAEPGLRAHLLVEASKRAFANRMQALQPNGEYRDNPSRFVSEDYIEAVDDDIEDGKATPLSALISNPVDWPETPSAVSFSVMDVYGGAVACTLTMNNAFGTGRVAEGFGIVLAAAPDTNGRTYTPVGPALLTSEFFDRAYMAVAASGGVTAPTALSNVLVRAAAGPESLADSMKAPRVHYSGVPDKVFVEQQMPDDVVQALRQRGHNVAITNDIGRVAAVFCTTGLPNTEEISCESATDPRGHGVALGGN